MSTPRFDDGSPYADLPFSDVGGYMRISVKTLEGGHPIADNRGRVMAHRAVLFDAIGVGPHVCDWCEYPGLRWDVDRSDPSYLVVDHRDGDGYDNVRSGLAAAHKWCNNNRSIIEQLGISWSTFSDVPPERRPALRVTSTGEPTLAAFKLAHGETLAPESDFEAALAAALAKQVELAAELAAATASPPVTGSPSIVAPVPTQGPRVVPDPPTLPRRRWGRRGRQASSEVAPINVIWRDTVELGPDGTIRLDGHGNFRLVDLPAELLEQHPQLRSIPFEKFGQQ